MLEDCSSSQTAFETKDVDAYQVLSPSVAYERQDFLRMTVHLKVHECAGSVTLKIKMNGLP